MPWMTGRWSRRWPTSASSALSWNCYRDRGGRRPGERFLLLAPSRVPFSETGTGERRGSWSSRRQAGPGLDVRRNPAPFLDRQVGQSRPAAARPRALTVEAADPADSLSHAGSSATQT